MGEVTRYFAHRTTSIHERQSIGRLVQVLKRHDGHSVDEVHLAYIASRIPLVSCSDLRGIAGVGKGLLGFALTVCEGSGISMSCGCSSEGSRCDD